MFFGKPFENRFFPDPFDIDFLPEKFSFKKTANCSQREPDSRDHQKDSSGKFFHRIINMPGFDQFQNEKMEQESQKSEQRDINLFFHIS